MRGDILFLQFSNMTKNNLHGARGAALTAVPPAVTVEMAKGFSLFMVKAVMSGRGDELIDLARTNLWR
jgi:hypothetical protein